MAKRIIEKMKTTVITNKDFKALFKKIAKTDKKHPIIIIDPLKSLRDK